MNWLRIKLQNRRFWALALLVAGGSAAVLIWLLQAGIQLSPETAVQQYVATVYARDYGQAYDLISATDKSSKSREEYLLENSSFTGLALEMTRQLASYIEFGEIQVDRQGNQAIVTVQFVIPDGNAEVVQELLAASGSSSELTETAGRALLTELDQLHESGQLPTLEGEQTFTLVREGGRWRIFENWAEAVRVHFSGELMDGLPWEFKPLQETVLAMPGESLQTVYWAKNASDRPITAKARHIDGPEEHLDSLTIIQCFCFIQYTLQPGEESELPLVFRVAWDVPSDVKDFYVHYEFYPIESFPEEEGN
jgi:hypothetical protein